MGSRVRGCHGQERVRVWGECVGGSERGRGREMSRRDGCIFFSTIRIVSTAAVDGLEGRTAFGRAHRIRTSFLRFARGRRAFATQAVIVIMKERLVSI